MGKPRAPCPPCRILLSNDLMKTPPNTCVNHPKTSAKRKCYHCLANICPACQRRAGGHIFCSVRCQYLEWLSERMTSIRRLFLRLGLRVRRTEKSVKRVTGGSVLRILSTALLLVILYQTILLTGILSDISTPAPASAPLPVLPTIELVHDGDWVTVAGSAAGFGVAILLSDGEEREVCTVKENRFSFHFQPLANTRSVQVQVYGDNLPSVYTRAIPLPEKNLKADGEKAPPQTTRGGPEPTGVRKNAAAAVKKNAASPSFADRSLTEDISRGSNGSGRVAITFDGGSYDNAAGRILDVLAKRGLEATFFLTGDFMNRYPEMTRRIAGEGHEVGNHTYSHLHLTTFEKNLRQDTLPGVSRELVQKELIRNEKLFKTLTGHEMVKLWRAPYGEQNKTIRKWAAEKGYRHVSWTYDPKTRKSLDSLDWVADRDSSLYLTSDQIVEKILSFDSQTEMGLAGGIVLLHLGTERRQDPFYPKLGYLIDRLEEKGYRIGPVGGLFETGG